VFSRVLISEPTLVWCTSKSFFAADLFYYNYLPPEIDSADLSLAVSDTIYEHIAASGKKVHLINHGLQTQFVKAAEILLQKGKPIKKEQQLVAGYIGNLRMEALDRETMKEVIRANPAVRFLFWGSFQKRISILVELIMLNRMLLFNFSIHKQMLN